MPVESIKAKNGRGDTDPNKPVQSVSVDVNVPGNLAEFVAVYGEPAVYGLARKRFVSDVQALIRNGLVAGSDQAAIEKSVAEYVPGATRARGTASPYDKVLAQLNSGEMTSDQLEALKNALRQAQRARAA